MTDLGVVLLGLCGGTFSACSGNAEGVEVSLVTLNSIIPNLSDTVYDSNILGHCGVFKNIKSNL